MKISTGIVIAGLAATGLAQPARRDRHARFHESKRSTIEKYEMYKRALESDASLETRGCGTMITTTINGKVVSFPDTWDCDGSQPVPAAGPVLADSASPASSPAASPPPVQEKHVEAPKHSDAPKPAQQSPAPSSSDPGSSSDSGSGSGSSPGSASGGGFAGLAYNDASLIGSDWLGGSATWAYNWAYQPGKLSNKLQYVPMCHGKADVQGFKGANFAKGTPLLSLNEPDQEAGVGGVKLSPSDACAAHKDAFSGYGGNYVSAPAVSSEDKPGMGLDWLTSFHQVCGDAKVDFVPLHWYGLAGQTADQQASAFIAYISTATSKVGQLYPNKKIWFTEFAASPINNADLNKDFLAKVLPALKSAKMVERAAPFMVGAKGMLGTDAPSVAGKVLLAA